MGTFDRSGALIVGERRARAVCAGLAFSDAVYAVVFGVIAFWGLVLSGPTAPSMLGMVVAVVFLVAAVGARALAVGGDVPVTGFLAGALGGIVLVAATLWLYFGSTTPRPPRTTIALVLAGLQAAAVPAMAWLIRRHRRR